MSFNKESNGYIFTFLVGMVLVVATLLSFITSALSPIIDQNVELDKKTQILQSVIIVTEEAEDTTFTKDFVESTYGGNITEMVVNSEGETIGDNAFELDFKKELKKDLADRNYPVYEYEKDGKVNYIIPLEGLGLWDRIYGYLALEDDFNTIRGASFGHVGETPGLGARLTEYWFRSQFQGKKLYGDDGSFALDVLKGEGNAGVDEKGGYKVDGMSGATITSDGTEDMLAKCVDLYQPFFNTVKTI